ncbi:MAG: Glu/Leu/Phe/Val dehydrogenase dimerization domain-containing protein [Gemmatimonadota bacterium]
MLESRALQVEGHEAVFEFRDDTVGYLSFIAIHSTTPGPAIGGTRLARYRSDHDALHDALSLSRAMSYKAALAGLPAGGGKSVIVARDGANRDAVLAIHGQVVESLAGRYITAVDVGINSADLTVIGKYTSYVALHTRTGGGDGTDTARGVFAAMRAAALERWGAATLEGRSVAIQGCGNVGCALAKLVHAAGGTLTVSDVDVNRAEALAAQVECRIVGVDAIHTLDIDFFAPCALGGVLTTAFVEECRMAIVVGGANNQLADRDVAGQLAGRGILYVPDYLANAGGLIAGVYDWHGCDLPTILQAIDGIFDRTRDVLRVARERHDLPVAVADRMAEARLTGNRSPPLSLFD